MTRDPDPFVINGFGSPLESPATGVTKTAAAADRCTVCGEPFTHELQVHPACRTAASILAYNPAPPDVPPAPCARCGVAEAIHVCLVPCTCGPRPRVLVRLAEGAAMPFYATEGAAGLDLSALGDHSIPSWSNLVIPTGVELAIPDGYEGQIRPRSGLAKRGLVATLGTIDSDFRGAIKVNLWNFSPRSELVRQGDRIAQLVIAPVARVRLAEATELPATVRGDRGWGSTG